MITRLKLLLFSAIPTGAVIICFLWKYTTNRRKSLEQKPDEICDDEVASECTSIVKTSKETGTPGFLQSTDAVPLEKKQGVRDSTTVSPMHRIKASDRHNSDVKSPTFVTSNISDESIIKNYQNSPLIITEDHLTEDQIIENQSVSNSTAVSNVETSYQKEEESHSLSDCNSSNILSARNSDHSSVSQYDAAQMSSSQASATDSTHTTAMNGFGDSGIYNQSQLQENGILNWFAEAQSEAQRVETESSVEDARLSVASLDSAVISVGGPLSSNLNSETYSQIENSLNDESAVRASKHSSWADEVQNETPLNDVSSLKTSKQFDLPSDLCGMLIGRLGRNINMIKQQSGASVVVTDKKFTNLCRLVTVEGSKEQVDSAMDLITRKFPRRRYPQIDFSRSEPDVEPEQETTAVSSGLMQLSLPLGVQLDVFISCVVSPNHVFLQQPTHPTFPDLERQAFEMRKCYSAGGNIPGLPRPLEVGVICAAPVNGYWHRAQIVSTNQDSDECDIRLVDLGGYMHVSGSVLKQIRYIVVEAQQVSPYIIVSANKKVLCDGDKYVSEHYAVVKISD